MLKSHPQLLLEIKHLKRKMKIRKIIATTILLTSLNAFALEEKDYRGVWLASSSAIQSGKPQSIDVGYFSAKIRDNKCDISYPVTFDSQLGYKYTKTMEVSCNGYQAVTLAYFEDELNVFFGDYTAVTCEHTSVQLTLNKKLGIPLKENCKRPKSYTYTREGRRDSKHSELKLKTF